jgi:hypothetical protein
LFGEWYEQTESDSACRGAYGAPQPHIPGGNISGGVYVYSGEFTMNGGNISDWDGGGVIYGDGGHNFGNAVHVFDGKKRDSTAVATDVLDSSVSDSPGGRD